jgi:hypothetical protein
MTPPISGLTTGRRQAMRRTAANGTTRIARIRTGVVNRHPVFLAPLFRFYRKSAFVPASAFGCHFNRSTQHMRQKVQPVSENISLKRPLFGSKAVIGFDLA